MTTPEVRDRLRRKAEEVFGVAEADLLLDRPPGGWGDLVTNATLDARLREFEARLHNEVHEEIERQTTVLRLELLAELHQIFNAQTWRLVGAMTAMMAVVVGALKF